jgi:hypothetical protein
MNFDELQAQWGEESDKKIQLPTNLDQSKQAQTPIDLVRKNMKTEFFVQLICAILLLFTPQYFNFPPHLQIIFIFFYGLLIAFTAYYFIKFYNFYKQSYDLTFDSRKNLMWFYYELKLSMELYKALTYILFFISFSFAIIAYSVLKLDASVSFDQTLTTIGLTDLKSAIISTLMITLASFTLAEFWPRYYYGKYLKQIKAVLDQLDA